MTTNPEKRFKKQKTYETFEQDAKASGLYDTFEQSDLDIAKQDVDYGYRLLKNKQGYVNADTEEDKQLYVDIAAQDRAQYQPKAPTVPQGSGKQSDASANILSIIKAYDDSLPGDKSSKWMKTVDSLFGQLAGDKFSYDPESDPLYAVSQKYAERAMKNQMAESALLTGGYGNSYAAATGQQVYADTMEDAVGELEQNAYNRWKAERDNKYDLLGIAQGLEQQEYDRAENERQWAYQEAQDAKEEEWRNKEWNYGVEQDALDRDFAERQFAYNKLENDQARMDDKAAEVYNKQLYLAEMLAAGGDFSGYRKLGLNDAQIASMQEAYLNEKAKANETVYEPPLSYAAAYKQYTEENDRSGAVMDTLRYYNFDFGEGEVQTLGAPTEDDINDIFAEKGVPDIFRTEEYYIPYDTFEAEKVKSKGGKVAAKLGEVTKYFDDWYEYIDAFADFYAKEDPEEYEW